jgi:maltose/moltooligosaccharide transporter
VTATAAAMGDRPRLSFWQIWNMCFGFLGVQFGFALQNANVSRIFQTLGAEVDAIPMLWIAAPLTGLLVQPVVGYFSDRTWNSLGRRRPYFLGGALLASAALIFMPMSPVLWVAAGLLWILDASINVAMEPFRAFVGDQLPKSQRPTGYATQSFFIGVGAVVASALPWMLAQAGVSNEGVGSGASAVPETVRFSFYIGAAVLLGAILWTVFTTREYPPAELHGFADAVSSAEVTEPGSATGAQLKGAPWAVAGLVGAFVVYKLGLSRDLYLLCGMFTVWGVALLWHGGRPATGLFTTLMNDIAHMPHRMRQLVPVQFFSWLALFAMWIYTTAAVTQVHFGATDSVGKEFNEGANWVGVLFAAYNGFAAVAAVAIAWMVPRLGLRVSHLVNLTLGALGLASFLVIRDPDWLIVSMVGVGFAWASILSLPYAMLCDCVPSRKMGVYMGIFNFFIVIPQLVAASVLGAVLRGLFDGKPIYALVLGGASFLIAGLFALRVR